MMLKATILTFAVVAVVFSTDPTSWTAMDNHLPSAGEDMLLSLVRAIIEIVNPGTNLRSGNNREFALLKALRVNSSSLSSDVDNATLSPVTEEPKDSELEGNQMWSLVDICNLQPLIGNCKGRIQRFYWDIKLQKCLPFTYGGCGGNVNNFLSERDCLDSCNHMSSPLGSATMQLGHSHCFLQTSVGDCKGCFPRFTYNGNTGKCESFQFGGCGGNKNSFKSLSSCESSCQHADPKSVCQLPSVLPGPSCLAKMTRYFYNVSSRSCEKFFYGGCHSTANNFQTELQCQNVC